MKVGDLLDDLNPWSTWRQWRAAALSESRRFDDYIYWAAGQIEARDLEIELLSERVCRRTRRVLELRAEVEAATARVESARGTAVLAEHHLDKVTGLVRELVGVGAKVPLHAYEHQLHQLDDLITALDLAMFTATGRSIYDPPHTPRDCETHAWPKAGDQ